MEAGDGTSTTTGRTRARLRRITGVAAGTRLRRAGSLAVLTAAALLFGVAPVVGDGLNRVATPSSPEAPATRVATSAQESAAGPLLNRDAVSATAAAANKKSKRVSLESRVTDEPIVTEENRGSYVGVKCPKSSKAISGGVLNKYINLLISSSAPNHPISGKYTPHTWWLTVTNANVDGQGGSLPWRGVVNCLKPVTLKK